MDALLAHRTAIVTGAGSERGLGRAIAELFAEEGARVAVVDLDGDAAGAVAEQIPGAVGYRCDVTDRGSVERTVSSVTGDLGPPTVLVPNAGVTQPKGVAAVSDADYDRVMDVSMRGTYLCSQAVVDGMRAAGGGSIVCMSSVSAKQGGGVFGGPHYCAAKAAVLGWTRALARELAPEGIRVNAVAPGAADTDIRADFTDPDRERALAQGIPMGRIADPREVAMVCLFLASAMSSYVTGEIVDVNGGSHID